MRQTTIIALTVAVLYFILGDYTASEQHLQPTAIEAEKTRDNHTDARHRARRRRNATSLPQQAVHFMDLGIENNTKNALEKNVLWSGRSLFDDVALKEFAERHHLELHSNYTTTVPTARTYSGGTFQTVVLWSETTCRGTVLVRRLAASTSCPRRPEVWPWPWDTARDKAAASTDVWRLVRTLLHNYIGPDNIHVSLRGGPHLEAFDMRHVPGQRCEYTLWPVVGDVRRQRAARPVGNVSDDEEAIRTRGLFELRHRGTYVLNVSLLHTDYAAVVERGRLSGVAGALKTRHNILWPLVRSSPGTTLTCSRRDDADDTSTPKKGTRHSLGVEDPPIDAVGYWRQTSQPRVLGRRQDAAVVLPSPDDDVVVATRKPTLPPMDPRELWPRGRTGSMYEPFLFEYVHPAAPALLEKLESTFRNSSSDAPLNLRQIGFWGDSHTRNAAEAFVSYLRCPDGDRRRLAKRISEGRVSRRKYFLHGGGPTCSKSTNGLRLEEALHIDDVRGRGERIVNVHHMFSTFLHYGSEKNWMCASPMTSDLLVLNHGSWSWVLNRTYLEHAQWIDAFFKELKRVRGEDQIRNRILWLGPPAFPISSPFNLTMDISLGMMPRTSLMLRILHEIQHALSARHGIQYLNYYRFTKPVSHLNSDGSHFAGPELSPTTLTLILSRFLKKDGAEFRTDPGPLTASEVCQSPPNVTVAEAYCIDKKVLQGALDRIRPVKERGRRGVPKWRDPAAVNSNAGPAKPVYDPEEALYDPANYIRGHRNFTVSLGQKEPVFDVSWLGRAGR
eukprot:PhM_4_TR18071/c0_g1_i5/m.44755